jgi:hypothetical protein
MYGCTYFIKGSHTLPVFFDESMGQGGDALMNIDGADVSLKFVRPAKGAGRNERQEVSDYTAPGIKVRVTRVKGKDVGSGTEYSGTINATKHGRAQTVRITGFCGA